MKVHPAAVIFDMDGLMLDTERPLFPLWEKAGKTMGYDIGPEIVIRTIGLRADGIRNVFLREFGPDFPYDALLAELRPLITEEFGKGIAHKQGLLPLLDHLASLNVPLAVATSNRRESALRSLGKANILERFAAIATGDEIQNGKPAPDIFLLAAEKLAAAPAECVGFEDSPAGLRGLHAAGMRSVFVKDLIEPPEEVLAAVWRRCNDLAEAADLFE